MTEHTKVDHSSDNLDESMPSTPGPTVLEKSKPRSANMAANKVECNACPVLCQITEGRTGACDRWGNVEGVLTRVDPVILMRRPVGPPADTALGHEGEAAAHQGAAATGSELVPETDLFVSGVGSGTTYPDYKPAPFIVGSKANGVDMVTVVTEGIFSYCSFKVKIDTDRYLGPEQSNIRHKGEIVGHVTTAEYGSQMLSLGGVHHLTGGSKKEGRITCDVMMALGNKQAVELTIDGGAQLVVQAGKAPIVDGVEEKRMRVGCGSAAIGIFAKQWFGHTDEVVVVDDHITGVLSEHQAGRCLDIRPSGIKMKGRKSTPGRYFQVANPGNGWGGTDITDPLSIIEGFDPEVAWPGLRLLITSTTGEHAEYYELDDALQPQPKAMPEALQKTVERIGENCEPSLASVLFLAGAGGSLRAGVTENPIWLTNSIKQSLVNVTCGGAPAYIWAGGGITVMVDVMRMPDNSFGYVPTPAIVAPIEFSMRLTDYERLGGHMADVQSVADVLARADHRVIDWFDAESPWPIAGRPVLG
ncbi:MAG TPA: 6-hydroxynicotinate reductase [Pusillimonas sp.]|uniref:6-hydroxynicotinate reductase n=1 Tax=Pusillimonas sp. TaxID=3040095 RepID=UPI002BBABDE0|nr:6-hydroxynicotinate reductase [Pusillimonas sp.]HUH87550.1 6-hydroxynicotinate reductase [Pusillimonas sp.]